MQEEIKSKNKELLILTEKIQNLERKIKNISQEQLKSYTEIQKNMEDYTNIVKKIQSSLNSRNYTEVGKLNDNAYKKWIELMGKLGVELKINNLKNSNSQRKKLFKNYRRIEK